MAAVSLCYAVKVLTLPSLLIKFSEALECESKQTGGRDG